MSLLAGVERSKVETVSLPEKVASLTSTLALYCIALLIYRCHRSRKSTQHVQRKEKVATNWNAFGISVGHIAGRRGAPLHSANALSHIANAITMSRTINWTWSRQKNTKLQCVWSMISFTVNDATLQDESVKAICRLEVEKYPIGFCRSLFYVTCRAVGNV